MNRTRRQNSSKLQISEERGLLEDFSSNASLFENEEPPHASKT